jgi:hypothetical protein
VKNGRAAPAPAPIALRLLHAIVFFGFAASAIAGTHIELIHLYRSLAHPFHSGTLPGLFPCISGVTSILLAAFLLVRLLLRQTAPLAVSALMLVAFGLSFTTLLIEPSLRSVPGANAKALEAAREVHADLNTPLQSAGRVPEEMSAPKGESPFRRRGFAPLPWHVEKVASLSTLPAGAEPGWILVHVNDDRAGFSIGTVGVNSEGAPVVLADEHGEPIELRGAFNPDTAR